MITILSSTQNRPELAFLWALSLKHRKSRRSARNFANFPPEKHSLKTKNKEKTIKQNDEVARERKDIKQV